MGCHGTTVLITGASSGLARALALAREGANLVVTALREALLETLREETGQRVLVGLA